MLLQLTTLMQDVMKGDSGVIAMMDISTIDEQLSDLKDKVTKMDISTIDKQLSDIKNKVTKIEQRCTCNLQEITENGLPTVGIDRPVGIVTADEEMEAVKPAVKAERVAVETIERVVTDKKIVPEKEEIAKEIPKVVVDKPDLPMLASKVDDMNFNN